MCKQDISTSSLETKNIEDTSDSSTSGSSSGSSSGSDRGSDSSSDSESGSASSDSGSSSSSSNDDNGGKNENPATEKKESPKKPTTVRNTVNKPLEKKTTTSTKAIKKTTKNSSDDDSTSSSESTPAPSPKKIPKVMSSAAAKRAAASKQTTSTQHSHPPGGGKAPPSVVKQHQQNFVKTQQQNRAKNPITKPGSILKNKKKAQNKKTAPVDSSDEESSEDGSDRKRKKVKAKNTNYSSSSSSTTTSSSGSSDEGSNSQSSKSSEKTKKALKPVKKVAAPGINLSDSEKEDKEAQLVTPTKNPIRKLTRSSSTRKSKHVVPKKTSESESELDIDKRSSTKSPAKRPANSKVKRDLRDDVEESPPVPPPPTPPPDEQKCPVDGCDSSGHLSGNQDKHYLPEACPIYHNMSTSECKERLEQRKKRDKEIDKILAGYRSSADKHSASAEQKAFLANIREKRNHFEDQKNLKGGNDPLKKEIDCDIDREPNLVGMTSEYDLNLFREAQAIASEAIEKEVKDVVVGKGIKYVIMGKYQMKVWYQSPYPDDTTRIPKMYICEFCLRYQKSEIGIKRHAAKCLWRHPPGDEIYRKGKLQVWQVDGKKHKQYCQHLCLLAKFFLDHKTLYYDVEPFLFYIMTLADTDGCHTVGYFSKEKNSFYNVSCILTLPPYQRRGYGRLLIDFSYLLTKTEDKIGSPEKPLSDLGLISYRSYWKDKLLNYLCSRGGSTLTIKDISTEMAIYSYDIVSTLQALGMIKYWKGKHIVLKKQDVLEEFQDRNKRKAPIPRTDSECLRWVPFVPKQNNLNTN